LFAGGSTRISLPGRADRDGYQPNWSNDFTSYGVVATVDILTDGSSRLAVLVEAQSGLGHGQLMPFTGRQFNYTALTVGLAYHRR
jgi:hypothetical protein